MRSYYLACTQSHPRYATLPPGRTTHVCLLQCYQNEVSLSRVSGEVPRLLRRASFRFFSSSFVLKMDLTAGTMADCSRVSCTYMKRLLDATFLLTFLLFPASSFNGSSKPPGPMLLLRVFLLDLFAEELRVGLSKEETTCSPSAMFSLSIPSVMVESRPCRSYFNGQLY